MWGYLKEKRKGRCSAIDSCRSWVVTSLSWNTHCFYVRAAHEGGNLVPTFAVFEEANKDAAKEEGRLDEIGFCENCMTL